MSPKALERRPPYYDWMDEYFKAFDVLCCTRQVGMVVGPIQLQQIESYLRLFGCSDPIKDFVHLILIMDSAWMEATVAKRERETKEQQPKS
jgi:hypothetical protein